MTRRATPSAKTCQRARRTLVRALVAVLEARELVLPYGSPHDPQSHARALYDAATSADGSIRSLMRELWRAEDIANQAPCPACGSIIEKGTPCDVCAWRAEHTKAPACACTPCDVCACGWRAEHTKAPA